MGISFANLVMLDLAYLDTEQMRILLLDRKSQLVEKVNSYQGTVDGAVMRAAEIFRPAVIRNCPGLILCHNHPSGDPTPSPKDRSQVTRYLIGINPSGYFINPDLLALTHDVALTEAVWKPVFHHANSFYPDTAYDVPSA